MQLTIKNILATPVDSSIRVNLSYFDILSEVKTTRQNPNKLEDVFRIWCDLLFAIGLTILFLFCCLIDLKAGFNNFCQQVSICRVMVPVV